MGTREAREHRLTRNRNGMCLALTVSSLANLGVRYHALNAGIGVPISALGVVAGLIFMARGLRLA